MQLTQEYKKAFQNATKVICSLSLAIIWRIFFLDSHLTLFHSAFLAPVFYRGGAKLPPAINPV